MPRVLAVMSLLALLASTLPLAYGAVTLMPGLSPSAAIVDPDDFLTLTVRLDNAASSANAPRVWANVTLHASFQIFSDNATSVIGYSGTWVTGRVRHYNFTDLPRTDQSFDVIVRVAAGPADGATLRSTLAVNFTDDTGALQPELTAQASVTMSIPVLTISKTPSASSVDPGDVLTYTIVVTNSGSAAADVVWLNDTLPADVTFSRVRNIPPAWCVQEDCTLNGLASGGGLQTYEIEVVVSPTAVRGTFLVNTMDVAFTDNDGTSLSPLAADAPVEVRLITDMTLDMIADASIVFPTAIVTFTIYYNNTATGNLQNAWINDTIPAGLAYTSSVPPATVTGSTARWSFTGVAPGSHSIDLLATVTAVTNGTVLLNSARADYRNASGQTANPLNASTGVVVSTATPVINLEKVAGDAEVAPGGTVGFTIWYNNTGTQVASELEIVDTIPVGTALTNPSVAPTQVNGRVHVWRFADVAPGTHSLTYVLVLLDVAADTTIFNVASVNYTDGFGRPLPSGPPRSAFVRVSAGGGGDGGSALPLFVGVVAAFVVLGFLAYRTLGRPKAVIDEVFLLHRDGLLIKHYTRRMRPDVDSDILSGMLIAVQNFVNDSFIGSEGLQKEGTLDELRFGEFKIVIERGQWVIVAAVLSGDPTDRVKHEVKAAIVDLEAKLGGNLDGWAGDMKAVEGADAFMQDLITGKYRLRVRGKG